MNVDILKYFTSAVRGTPDAVADYKRNMACKPNIYTGLTELKKRCPSSPEFDDQVPIFLFSAGWRSGSTLLQRLLVSDSEVFLWGEPYDHCGLVQAMAETTKAFTPEWPPQRYFYDGSDLQQLSERWIADLYPSLESLRSGHRAVFEAMFAQPAYSAGAVRWGLKEVRLGIEHAHYLKWLFPRAKFIFLYRNPLEAYQSYCGQGRSWYDRWPQGPVFTARQFGKHWRRLAEGYLSGAEHVDGLVIRYEDLLEGGRILDDLEKYLLINVDRAVLNNKVGSSNRQGQDIWVSKLQKWLLKRAVSPLAEELNYSI